jgi:chromosome segregation protein
MYISELKLQGFKSFAHQTNLSFDNGVTAVVGPNGCGKSNIVDSLRWVLGEQRPTLLRSVNMTNIIFNGSEQKKALGMAEVLLTFINNKGLLPTEYSEVTIGRRLYRSGESEYLINGTSCRLKDIMELFMDTGMSSDAYSVIELKMVEDILSNKNNDRRRLFEEAAGITSYKEKRKKTLRKLDATRKDLQRVEDVVTEIRKNVRSLERQAKKAQKAQKYRKEFTHLDKALSRYNYQKLQAELEPLKERIVHAEEEKKQILTGLEKHGGALENAQEELKEKERREADVRRRFRQLENTLQQAETDLRVSREKINTGKNLIKQYTGDIKQAGQDLKELKQLFDRTEKELTGYRKNLAKAEYNLKDSQSTYSDIQQTYNDERQALEELNKARDEADNELNKIRNRRIKIKSRQETIGEEFERIEAERESLQEKINQLQQKSNELSNGIKKAHEKQNQDEDELEKGREKREQLAAKQDELKDQIRRQQSKCDSIQSEKELLEEIAQSNEAFPSSVKYLLENHADEFNCLSVVSRILSTDEAHAVALEAVLDTALNYIIVETMGDAQRAGNILKKNNKGSATFIPLELLADHYETQDQSLAHDVKTPDKFTAVKQLLLGKVIMADSIEDWAGSQRDGITGVTQEGEVITDRQFLQSGSAGKNAGMRVGLKDKIKALEEQLSRVSQIINRKKKELDEVRESQQKINLQKLEQRLEESRKYVREQENLYNDCQSKSQVYQSNIEELAGRKQSLKTSEKSTARELAELKPLREKLDKSLEGFSTQQSQKEAALSKLEEDRSIAQSRFQQTQLKLQNLKNKVENRENELQRADDGIESLKSRIEKRSGKKQEAQQKTEANKWHIDTLADKIEGTKQEKQKAEAQLKEASESSAKQRGLINKVEDESKELHRRKEVNMELLHHLSMAKEKLELQADNVSDHVWETYEILMDQIEAALPETKKPDEAKEQIDRLRMKLNRMGEVNELAVEEYEEERERMEFYDEQINDLSKAREELQETIREINNTATERFNQTFEKVRTNFQRVFHILFHEDDYCDLLIDENPDDLLESRIEIKANPRGKLPSTITQLSSGEKTLTAIALLFAIYLVKPSPFCVLDEVDAPLDDANIGQFNQMIKRFSEDTQFIIITHNKKTMSEAEMIYGVTMPEPGISRLVGVEMEEVMQAGMEVN